MCHGSAVVRNTEEVVAGMTYRVMNISDAPSRPGRTHRRIAALAPPGTTYTKKGAPTCVVCFKERITVSIGGVPEAVRRAYRLPETLVQAWLVPGGPTDDTDYVYVPGRDPIDLARFIDENVRITVQKTTELPEPRRTSRKAQELLLV